MKKILLVIGIVSVLAACGPSPQRQPTSQELEERKQEEMQRNGINSVGMPAIVNYSEKRMMKDIIELRDKMQPTYTYVMDMSGRYHKICDSIGYGLPYATQYTNPQKKADWGSFAIAQADPNGLYSPASADGTWIMCLNPKTRKAEPQYIEPHVFVMTYPLE